ncbi:MAG: hypothetical protein Q9204_001796 [Flavoplaca sp. TL-2023a]
MTPLSAVGDGPDSLLSPITSSGPIPQGGTGIPENPGHVTPPGTRSPHALAASISRSSSRHSQLPQRQQHNLSSRGSSPTSLESHNDTPRQTILASFAPRVACFASEDTDDIAKEKGYLGGFYSLLRPFAEHVAGKVVIRDSIGASKAWDDFGVRLIQYRDEPRAVVSSVGQLKSHPKTTEDDQLEQRSSSESPSIQNPNERAIESLVTRTIHAAREYGLTNEVQGLADTLGSQKSNAPSPAYVQYLRKMLSEAVQEPYETFSHPVACIVAVSSRSLAPLEKLRQLYSYSGRANNLIPPWVAVDYLRYYVLVHDEDHDDIVKSTALFDLMKRHFGLHCFLLRIRSLPCEGPNNDVVEIPRCHWTTADEELSELEEYDSGPASSRYIFESDAIAIRNLFREMLTQSIVPFMERRVVTWNDQVASKRRGIGGRFMSLSKRWTGFGSAKGASQANGTGQNSPNSNFDPSRGYYSPEAPEAVMRQLADYAFMLRDYKLAYNTYDSLRTDFSNDKAWAYHASANELAGVSFLLIPQVLSTKARSEVIDQKIEAALYSYLTRCSLPFGAIRSILLTVELLVGRGPGAAEDAAKWAMKSLELGVLSPILQVLITERIADIRQAEKGTGIMSLGSRKRQAALWHTLASALWTKLGEPGHAGSRLHMARTIVNSLCGRTMSVPFPTMRHLYSRLESKESNSDVEDEPLIDFDSAPVHDHMNGTLVDLTERPKHEEFSDGFDVPDAGGFSTIEANHPNFEKSPMG